MKGEGLRIIRKVGWLCEAGQHRACAAVYEEYSGYETDGKDAAWACTCRCHESADAARGEK